jgi:hypothetical protein
LPVLRIGGVDDNNQQQAHRVNQDMMPIFSSLVKFT